MVASFHSKTKRAQCLLLALRDISLGCRIASLSEQSGHGPTCCRLNSVANDPKRTLRDGTKGVDQRLVSFPANGSTCLFVRHLRNFHRAALFVPGALFAKRN